MHVCSSKSVRELFAHPSVLHIQKNDFVFISYQDVKGLKSFLEHKVKHHKSTMGTGCYIYIDVM